MAINHLKSYIFGALAIAAVLGITSCGGKDGGEKVKFSVGTVQKVDSSLFGGNNIDQVLFNDAKKVAYVLDNKGVVYNVSLKGGLKDFTNKSNWKILKFKDTNRPGTKGKARLDEKEVDRTFRAIYPTQKGVLVRVVLASAAEVAAAAAAPRAIRSDLGALAYFEGDAVEPTYAWTSDAAHVDGAALAANSPWRNALAVTYGGKEYFVVANDAGEVSSVEIGENQFKGKHQYNGAAFTAGGGTTPEMAASNDTLYFVNTLGVSFIKLDKLGTNNDTVAVDPEAAAGKWEIVAGTPNIGVQEVLLQGDKLFIVLAAVGGNRGGIAVYDVKGNKTTAPEEQIWDNIAASHLKEHDSKVKAIVGNRWVEIKADGSIGESFSKDVIQNNRYKSDDRLASKENEGKKFYKVETAAFIDLAKFEDIFICGNDLLVRTDAPALFAITFEERELAVAQKKEKQE